MVVPDIYATAKANLRDNVKTLIAAFGAIAAVLLAGTPFTGYGRLPLWGDPWWIASLSLVFALILILVALRLLLWTLEPDLAYPSALKEDFKVGSLPWRVRPEITALRKQFGVRRDELMPGDARTVELLSGELDKAWAAYQQASDSGDSAEIVARTKQTYEDLVAVQSKVNNWAAFTRLHYRVRRGTSLAMVLGALILICVFSFASAVGSGASDTKTPTVTVICDRICGQITPPDGAASAPVFAHATFALGRSELSSEALKAVGVMRNFLGANPSLGVLLYAHTDTLGGQAINRTLADRRASAVRKALVEEGGVETSRVFVASLPETALPEVTLQETANPANRSVDMVVVTLPRR